MTERNMLKKHSEMGNAERGDAPGRYTDQGKHVCARMCKPYAFTWYTTATAEARRGYSFSAS